MQNKILQFFHISAARHQGKFLLQYEDQRINILVTNRRHGKPSNYCDPCLALDKANINPFYMSSTTIFYQFLNSLEMTVAFNNKCTPQSSRHKQTLALTRNMGGKGFQVIFIPIRQKQIRLYNKRSASGE